METFSALQSGPVRATPMARCLPSRSGVREVLAGKLFIGWLSIGPLTADTLSYPSVPRFRSLPRTSLLAATKRASRSSNGSSEAPQGYNTGSDKLVVHCELGWLLVRLFSKKRLTST